MFTVKMTGTELVQEHRGSELLPPAELADRFLKAGRALTSVYRRNHVSYETQVTEKKRLYGLLGTRTVQTAVPVVEVEEIPVWSIYPSDILEHDDMFRRYLAPDGRVFEVGID